MQKEVELVCVTGANNNKYYKMKDNGDGTFTARWGRVGGSEETKVYPMNDWDKIYRSKTKSSKKPKPYTDITLLRADAKSNTYKPVGCKASQTLLTSLQSYSSDSIKKNYTISSDNVTQAQVDKAQEIIDNLTNLTVSAKTDKLTKAFIGDFNDMCTELFTTIPRKMNKVQNFILHDDRIMLSDAKGIVGNEQDLLDVMAQQVSMNVVYDDNMTLAEALGINITKATAKDVEKIKKLMGDSSKNFKSAYILENSNTQKAFESRIKESYSDKCKLLWHGSRNENWLNIVKTGLLIRPSNAVLTGAMFGNGIYMADKAKKSMGYTSLHGSYWASGSSNRAYLALYDVNTGVEYTTDRHKSVYSSLDYQKLQKYGKYDSFFAKGGYDLRNNEYIIYDKAQCTIKYLVEIG